MLANDDSIDQFVGGTVYQAFLSANNYVAAARARHEMSQLWIAQQRRASQPFDATAVRLR